MLEVQYAWMWADAGKGLLGPGTAQLNPLRWSPWQNLAATLGDLGTYAQGGSSNRRVRLAFSSGGTVREFGSAGGAVAFLQPEAAELGERLGEERWAGRWQFKEAKSGKTGQFTLGEDGEGRWLFRCGFSDGFLPGAIDPKTASVSDSWTHLSCRLRLSEAGVLEGRCTAMDHVFGIYLQRVRGGILFDYCVEDEWYGAVSTRLRPEEGGAEPGWQVRAGWRVGGRELLRERLPVAEAMRRARLTPCCTGFHFEGPDTTGEVDAVFSAGLPAPVEWGWGARTAYYDPDVYRLDDPALQIEIAAALLSDWIYQVSDALPRMVVGGEAVVFRLNRTGEGSATYAIVTAEFPAESVLLLIFKGSSTFHDVARWNFQDINSSFMNCQEHFAHGGASLVLQELMYDEDSARIFKEHCAEAPSGSGCRELVVAGHSLGGMYATLLMRHVHAHPEFLGAARVRSVTFGAPMVFGSKKGAPFQRDFVEFMHERHRNFMHMDDPCPRAWAFDLDKALDIARNSWSHYICRVIGNVVTTKIDPIAQVKGSDEYERCLQLGPKYMHVGRMIVLNDTPVEDFSEVDMSKPTCLDDHRMQNYIQALTARRRQEFLTPHL
mmetsp:Transcript_13409/g.38105  ORF Transcript_13409/g.38105 Transcript_13409/m.38105 type:complete len:606 (+) Transcript_13409:30-1847(+)